jgi:hypothetical protein
MTVDELVLQDAGRDLRPDVVTPAPDLTSLAVAELEADGFEDEVAASAVDRTAESQTPETNTAIE